ncbi:MAG: zeta toxin family protein [bacterium]|nr:zeta toxin family protein [bacterium]
MDEELVLSQEALAYIKREKRQLLTRFVDPDVHKPSEHPVTLFMAGSPGAGKTEISKRLVESELFAGNQPVRIDADDIRAIFPGYTGNNSHVFQAACSVGVSMLYFACLKKRLNVIMDATFAYARALENVQLSLNKQRNVELHYLYQDPRIAWEFTQKREATEGRRVSLEVFIEAFLGARHNIVQSYEHFGNRITVNVLLRNFHTGSDSFHQHVTEESLDTLVPTIYTASELNTILKPL